MREVRDANPRLAGMEPYDARNLPVEVFLSANENPDDVPSEVKDEIVERLGHLPLNRYPDPLATHLRDLIAQANGLQRENVLVGNGGDEQLFNIFLAWGGEGRKFINLPPTFSIYANNACVTGTEEVAIPRRADYSIDEDAVIERAGVGDIDFIIVASPNNPTGRRADDEFIERLLDSTDALVLVDEAYFEFSRQTVRPLMMNHENLLILRTFSKAFSLAGVRVGYLLGAQKVISEFTKVRQCYSVDSVSQMIAEVVFSNRARFEPAIDAIAERRAYLERKLAAIEGVTPFPSDSNYILFHVDDAHAIWQEMVERYSVLVRDFSGARYLEDCLRVSVGSQYEVDTFLAALEGCLRQRKGRA